ncbi:MAG: hypothetical protein JNL67_00565 [Planctomycetaceae bacterium]|nr:hypothetical protein [Planctomycetaceae bacterium]
MFRTLLAISTGGLCTIGVWSQQEVQEEKQITVEVRSSDSADPEKLLREMHELRSQLLTVLGANHPAVRRVDAQIRQMSAEGSLAENVFAPRVIQGNASGVWSGNPEVGGVWLSSAEGSLAAPFIFDPEGVAVETNGVRQIFMAPSSVNLGNPTNGAAPNAEFRAKLATLRAKWTSSESEEAKKTVLEELRTTIATQFDTDLQRRKQQVESLEKKLEDLRKQVEKRESLRDKFVENLTEHTEMEWEGVSLQTERPTGVFSGQISRPLPPVVPGVAAPSPPPATKEDSTPPR